MKLLCQFLKPTQNTTKLFVFSSLQNIDKFTNPVKVCNVGVPVGKYYTLSTLSA